MSKTKPHALIVGGTSGLGLEIALLLTQSHSIRVTGRNRRQIPDGIEFTPLDLGSDAFVPENLDLLLSGYLNQQIDLLVWAAGFDENGTISDLEDSDIMSTLNVGLIAPAMFLGRLLRKQSSLGGFIAITSTSQITPRLREPMYCASKAGLAMLAQCLSLDPRVGKVLVAGPTGMNTPFWKSRGGRADADQLLSPSTVAAETIRLYAGLKEKFEAWLILRDPLRAVRMMEPSIE